MTATASFTPYKTKSDAKRGFGRKFKDGAYDPETYLVQEDGKWGFNTENGVPVLYSDTTDHQHPEAGASAEEIAAVTDPVVNTELKDALTEAGVDNETAEAYASGKVDNVDPELEGALRQHDEDGNDNPPSAFGAFAFAQLTAPQNNGTEPERASSTNSKIEKNREERNGVKRPSAGTLCAQVWDTATELSNGDEQPRTKIATLSEVVKACMNKGINQFTARTQYARWRVFHGITGRH